MGLLLLLLLVQVTKRSILNSLMICFIGCLGFFVFVTFLDNTYPQSEKTMERVSSNKVTR